MKGKTFEEYLDEIVNMETDKIRVEECKCCHKDFVFDRSFDYLHNSGTGWLCYDCNPEQSPTHVLNKKIKEAVNGDNERKTGIV